MLRLYNSVPFIFISSKTIVDLQRKNIKMTVIQYIWRREALFSLLCRLNLMPVDAFHQSCGQSHPGSSSEVLGSESVLRSSNASPRCWCGALERVDFLGPCCTFSWDSFLSCASWAHSHRALSFTEAEKLVGSLPLWRGPWLWLGHCSQQGKEVLFNSDELCPSPLQVPSSWPCVSLSQE